MPITHPELRALEKSLGARPNAAQVRQFRRTVMRHLHDEEQEESSMRKKTKRRATGAAAKAKKWTPAQRAAWKKKMDAAKKAKGRFGAKAKPKALSLAKSEAAPAKKAAKKSAKKAAPKKAAPKKTAKKSARPKNVPAKPKSAPKSRTLSARASKRRRKTTALVPPHLAASASRKVGGEGRGRPCLKCGVGHTISEHWSHRYMHGTERQRLNYRCKKGGACAFNLSALVKRGLQGDREAAKAAKRVIELEAASTSNPQRLSQLKGQWVQVAMALGKRYPSAARSRA